MASLNFDDEKQRFREWFGEQQPLFTRSVIAVRGLLSELLADNDQFSTPVITGRVKNRDESIAKFSRKYQSKCEANHQAYEIKDFITDTLGLRIVCLYENDVAAIKKIVVEHFEVLEETDKTAFLESHDDTFGYKGLHLDLKLKPNRTILPEYMRFRDLRFELQIRTTVQDAWSVLDHRIKYKKNIPDSLRRRINRLAALFELADQEFKNIRDETLNLEQQPKGAALAVVGIAQSELAKSLSWDSGLNAFTFSQIAEKYFPKYRFEGPKIDGFVGDLKKAYPSITAEELDEGLTKNLPTVDKYRLFQKTEKSNNLNPYTAVRHALYLSDKESYMTLLFNSQRSAFDSWLEAEVSGPAVQASH